MLIKHAARLGFLTGTLSLGAYSVSSPDTRRKTVSLASASKRIVKLVSTSCFIASDYAFAIYFKGVANSPYSRLVGELESLQSVSESLVIEYMKEEDERTKAILRERITETQDAIRRTAASIGQIPEEDKSSSLTEVHKRSADRLRDLCMRNKGIYIKLGQHLCQMDYLLPDEYIRGLEPLLSKNPESSWEAVQRVMNQDIGASLLGAFKEIEREPIASASLAQVHLAYGHDGRKYAVKVQHEGLLECSDADRAAITFVVNVISSLFEGFSYQWLTREMNKNLPLELDFKHEALNLARCCELFAHDDRIAFPKVREDLTSSRVLCMSFEEGVYINDLQAMRKRGLDFTEVARTISSVFCEQVYRHGFVHCDPHPHNVLVRKNPNKPGNKAQIVLLDHGLYRELSTEFRKNYCRLWRGILLGDEIAIREYCTRLNAGQLYTLLAAVLTMKPWDDIVSDDMQKLHRKDTEGESEMLKAYAKRYALDIVRLLSAVPSELLLLLKTNDCLRHIDVSLGVPVNTAGIIASTTASVILAEDWNEQQTLRGKWKAVCSYMKLTLRVMGLRLVEIFPALQVLVL